VLPARRGHDELSGLRRQHDERRIRAIVTPAAVRRDVDWHSREDEWSSLRPITASGLPMIGEFRAGRGCSSVPDTACSA